MEYIPAVNMPQHLHQPCFSAAPIKASDYVENLHGFIGLRQSHGDYA